MVGEGVCEEREQQLCRDAGVEKCQPVVKGGTEAALEIAENNLFPKSAVEVGGEEGSNEQKLTGRYHLSAF